MMRRRCRLGRWFAAPPRAAVVPAGAGTGDGAPLAWPDPSRYEEQIREFEVADRAAMPPPGAVVCTGSSSIRNWHGEIGGDLAPVSVVPRGFGGSTMYDLLHFIDRVVLPYRPRAVLVYEGDNDIACGLSPGAIMAVLEQFLQRLWTALPTTRVYLLAVKLSPSRRHLWETMTRVNDLLRQRCETDARLRYLDVATPLFAPDGTLPLELFAEDRLHLSRAGYEVWRDAVRAVLMPAETPFEAGQGRG